MGTRDNDRKKSSRDREHQRLEELFAEVRGRAKYAKIIFRDRGISLPFYEFYDSYVNEFSKVAEGAKKEFPSLLDITELDDGQYYAESQSHPENLKKIEWNLLGFQDGYEVGDDGRRSNLEGRVNAFRSTDGSLRTRISIRQAVPNTPPHREIKYHIKLIALLHELGHVHDIEHHINFNHDTEAMDVIAAEVYAHLYSLKMIAASNYNICFKTLMDILERYKTCTDYRGQVATRTLETMPDYKLIDVAGIPLILTEQERKLIGVEGVKVIEKKPNW